MNTSDNLEATSKLQSNLKKRRQLKKTSIVLSEEKLKKLSQLLPLDSPQRLNYSTSSPSSPPHATNTNSLYTPQREGFSTTFISVTTPSSCESITQPASSSSLTTPPPINSSSNKLKKKKSISNIFCLVTALFRGYLIRNLNIKLRKKKEKILNLQKILLEEFLNFLNLNKNKKFFIIETFYHSLSDNSSTHSSSSAYILSPPPISSYISSLSIKFKVEFLNQINPNSPNFSLISSHNFSFSFSSSCLWLPLLKFFLNLYDNTINSSLLPSSSSPYNIVRDPQRVLLNGLIENLKEARKDYCSSFPSKKVKFEEQKIKFRIDEENKREIDTRIEEQKTNDSEVKGNNEKKEENRHNEELGMKRIEIEEYNETSSSFINFDEEETNQDDGDNEEIKRLVQSVLEDYNNESIIIEEEFLSPFNKMYTNKNFSLFSASTVTSPLISPSSSPSSKNKNFSFTFPSSFNPPISMTHQNKNEEKGINSDNFYKDSNSQIFSSNLPDTSLSFISYFSEPQNNSSNPLLASVSEFQHSQLNNHDSSNKIEINVENDHEVIFEDEDADEINDDHDDEDDNADEDDNEDDNDDEDEEDFEEEDDMEYEEENEVDDEEDDTYERFSSLLEIIDVSLPSNLSKGFFSLNRIKICSFHGIRFDIKKIYMAIALPSTSSISTSSSQPIVVNSIEKLLDLNERLMLSLPLSIPTLKSHLNFFYGKNCKNNNENMKEYQEEIIKNGLKKDEDELDPSIFSLTFVPLPLHQYISLLNSLYNAWVAKKGGEIRIKIEADTIQNDKEEEIGGKFNNIVLTSSISLDFFVLPLINYFNQSGEKEIERPCVNLDRIFSFNLSSSSSNIPLPSNVDIFLSFSLISPSQDYLIDKLSQLILSERKKKISTINPSKIKRKSPEKSKIFDNKKNLTPNKELNFSRSKKIEEMINLAFKDDDEEENQEEDEEIVTENKEENQYIRNEENTEEEQLDSSFLSSTIFNSPSIHFRSQFMQTLTKTQKGENELDTSSNNLSFHNSSVPEVSNSSTKSSISPSISKYSNSTSPLFSTPPRVPRSNTTTPALYNKSPIQFETPERRNKKPFSSPSFPSAASSPSPTSITPNSQSPSATSKMIESLKSQLETLQTSHENASKAMKSFQEVLNKRKNNEKINEKTENLSNSSTSFINFSSTFNHSFSSSSSNSHLTPSSPPNYFSHKQDEDFTRYEDSNSTIFSEDEIIIMKGKFSSTLASSPSHPSLSSSTVPISVSQEKQHNNKKSSSLSSTHNSLFSHIILNEEDEKKFDPNNDLVSMNIPHKSPSPISSSPSLPFSLLSSSFSDFQTIKNLENDLEGDDLDDIENFDTSFIKSMVWNDSILEDE